jgi:hypothetical protein
VAATRVSPPWDSRGIPMIIRKVSHLPLGDPRAPPVVSGALTSSE